MKTTMKILRSILACFLLLFFTGCSKDEMASGNGVLDQVNGISADDLENYKGDLGLLINTRDIVKKGYNPTKVIITTTASQGNYDQEISIDPFTNIAQLKLSIDDLSASAEQELRNGVGLNIVVQDASNTVLSTQSYSIISFAESGNELNLNATSLAFQQEELYFKDNMNYYLQTVNANGNYSNNVVWKPSSALGNATRLVSTSTNFWPGITTEQYRFIKVPNESNVFSFYSVNTYKYIYIGDVTRHLWQSSATSFPENSPNSLADNWKFKIVKEANGLFTLRGFEDNLPLRSFLFGSNVCWQTNPSGTIQYFRIIALDIDWQVTALNTEYLQPILPSVDTSFGFNSTLRNCGSGTLEQQVGIQREVTTTFTSSLSESIGLSGRVTTSVDVSVSATAEASFFGNGGSVTGEVSAGLEVSVEASSTRTIGVENSTSETNTFFSSRTVTVPAGRASLVFDAYQTYSNVRVPYVKRLRLKGLHTGSSEFLTGQEIATQLRITNFPGVITNIGSDFVEINIKGNMNLDNMVDSVTEVRNVAANCN